MLITREDFVNRTSIKGVDIHMFRAWNFKIDKPKDIENETKNSSENS